MLRWQDPLSQEMEVMLNALAAHLREIKPQGWSVVFSENEVVVRPEDRTTGKFSITAVREGQFCVAFFSRELNIWNKRDSFAVNHAAAVQIKEWMQSEAVDPLKRV